MRTVVPLAVALAAFVLASNLACGSSSGGSGGSGGSTAGCSISGHCTVTEAGVNACSDFSLSAGQSACTQTGGTWASGSCSDHGIGGCKIGTSAACEINWYPLALSSQKATLQSNCASSTGTWVDP